MTAPRREPPVQFRSVGLTPELDARHENRNYVAERDLRRYYQVLQDELRGVDLSEAEACLICDACNGWFVTEDTYDGLGLQVGDSIQDGHLDAKWGVSAEELLAKVASWSPGATLAVIDAAERFWQKNASGETFGEQLRAVNLIR